MRCRRLKVRRAHCCTPPPVFYVHLPLHAAAPHHATPRHTPSAAAPPTFSLTFQAEDVTGPAPAKDTHQHMTFSVNVAGVAPSGVPLTAVRLAYSCGRHEAFYGFGHQYTYMNQATHYLPIFTQEQGVGRGLQPVTSVLDTLSHGGGGNAVTTYTSMPVYVTSANNSVMLTSTEYAVADLTWSQYRGIFAWEVQATTARGACHTTPCVSLGVSRFNFLL